MNTSEIQRCEDWIRAFIIPRKSVNWKHTSYGLKHAVERWSGQYIANEAFIQAAENLGYRAFRRRLNDINAAFQMSFVKAQRATGSGLR